MATTVYEREICFGFEAPNCPSLSLHLEGRVCYKDIPSSVVFRGLNYYGPEIYEYLQLDPSDYQSVLFLFLITVPRNYNFWTIQK